MAINPLAIGGGVVAAAAVVGGGLYAGGVFSSSSEQPGDRRGRNDETKWFPLSKDDGYANKIGANQEYNGKLGQTYGHYLVGLSDTNKKWWQEKFNKFFSSNNKPNKGKFKDVTESYGTKNESLSKVCSDAYKAATTDILATVPDGQESTKFKEEEVWKYCSFGEKKIKNISESTNEENSYSTSGSYGSTHKALLVSAVDEDSKWFWKLKEKELKETEAYPITGNGTNEESEFKKLWNNRSTYVLESFTIREKCKAAYAVTTTGTNNQYPKADIFKWCSLSGTAPN